MRMMDELKHLYLYSAKKQVYAPVNTLDKKKGAAITLLTPDMETSIKLTKLPYLHNPNLFTSFYIDRNVMAYVDNASETIDFDEVEEETISEAMISVFGYKTKFKYDDNVAMSDRAIISKVFCKESVAEISRILKLKKLPDVVKVHVHPTVRDLQKDAPKSIQNICKENLYSYIYNDTIHVLSKYVYDPEYMYGPYELYLKTELFQYIIMVYNQDIPYMGARAVALAITGCEEYMDSNKTATPKTTDRKVANTIRKIISTDGMPDVIKYVETANFNIFSKYAIRSTLNAFGRLLTESDLTYFERQRLLPSEFGIPETRKFPMPDESHVIQAIRMFNHAAPEEEEELAKNIIKKMKTFGMTDVKVSPSNRFSKYYKPRKAIKESSMEDAHRIDKYEFNYTDDGEPEGYDDIQTICSALSPEEFRRITFYDTYKNSKFILYRMIAKIDGAAAGFLDVYRFPSKPDIAQIVIAVNPKFRRCGVANTLVGELQASDLKDRYGFKTYYWTAHHDNHASQNLARMRGFKDMGYNDKYGRKVFMTDPIYAESAWADIPGYMKPDLHNGEEISINEGSIISSESAVFFEADESKYSDKLKRYLYRERLKNNREVVSLYERVKESNPDIKRTFPRLKMYSGFNVFVDTSYYHGLFLRKNVYKLDKAVNLYFEFINRLINNSDISAIYKKQTIFIPVDANTWIGESDKVDGVVDYRVSLNPISCFFRLVRTDLGRLRRAWGNKDIVFVGSRGYFKVDFSKIEIRDLNRIKTNLRKLRSYDEPIEDDFEVDSLIDDDKDNDMSIKRKDSSKAMAAKMVDRVERGSKTKIDNISSIDNTKVNDSAELSPHLKLTSEPMEVSTDKSNDSTVVISITPNGVDDYNRLTGSVLPKHLSITSYCKL